MKILFLTVRADLGGGPEHLLQLIAHAPEGSEVYVGCPRDEPYHQRYVDFLGAERIIEIPHRSFKLSALRALARVIRQQGIAVVHSHGKGAGLYGRILAAITPAQSVHTFHGLHVANMAGRRRQSTFGWRG
ncbi:MAG: glycosyltransferase [Marinovum sp.]|nr:glycosyltransferase [Marinovum sp.]